MFAVLVKMCFIKYHVLILCLIIFDCYALNCRSDGSPKEAELKNIYKKCQKMQEGKSSNSSKNSGQDWREPRGQQKQEWDQDRDKEEKSGRSDKSNGRERMSGRNGMSSDRDDAGRNNNDRNMDRNYGNERMENKKRMENERNDKMNNNGRYGRDEYFNNGGDFPPNDEFGEDIPRYSQYNHYSPSQPPRRYKREKRPENSGQRSQYNPNSQKIAGHEAYRSEEKNSGENNSSKDTDNKACALHCFLENLEMTGDDGMPDRYLVAHAITKDVKNEDLKDFLQESIEECFQILDNENTQDKCDFSKNLLMCLSEKGRANCDDWKDDLKF